MLPRRSGLERAARAPRMSAMAEVEQPTDVVDEVDEGACPRPRHLACCLQAPNIGNSRIGSKEKGALMAEKLSDGGGSWVCRDLGF